MVPLPERNKENHQIWSQMFENSDKVSRKQRAGGKGNLTGHNEE